MYVYQYLYVYDSISVMGLSTATTSYFCRPRRQHCSRSPLAAQPVPPTLLAVPWRSITLHLPPIHSKSAPSPSPSPPPFSIPSRSPEPAPGGGEGDMGAFSDPPSPCL